MRLIAVWSPLPSGSGATVMASALPVVLAMEYRVRTLLTHGGNAGERIEQAFTLRHESLDTMAAFQDHGMDALARIAGSGRLLPETIRDYTIPVLSERLDLLTGSRDARHALDDVAYGKFAGQVLDTAKRSYDVIVADAGNGRPQGADMELIRTADLVVVALNQNLRSLEDVWERSSMPDMLMDKNCVYALGRYDPEISCTLKNIKRRFRLKSEMYGIPYCSSLADAWNMRSVMAYVQRSRGGLNRSRENAAYRALRQMADLAAERLGLPSGGSVKARGAYVYG